jgi:hypothetical protein
MYKIDERINLIIPEKEKIELRIMCILTHRSMSQFIRVAIQEKIKTLKNRPIVTEPVDISGCPH